MLMALAEISLGYRDATDFAVTKFDSIFSTRRKRTQKILSVFDILRNNEVSALNRVNEEIECQECRGSFG